MILDFSEIPQEGLALDRHLDGVEAAEDGTAPLVPERVRLVGRARPGARGVELAGRVTATVRLECSRCLETFEVPIRSEFALVVVSEAVEFGAGERRVELEETNLFYADRGKVDLREVAREQILLNLPLKPVCGEGCAGLCPTCGANRNRIECSCRSDEIDPRLAPLQALKKKMEEPPS
jgi:uncharacterized protein